MTNFEEHPLVKKLGFSKEYEDYLNNLLLFKERNKYFLTALTSNKSLQDLGLNVGFYGFTEEAFNAFRNMRKGTELEILAEDKGKLFGNKKNKFSEEDKKALYLDLHEMGIEKVAEVLSRKLGACFGKDMDKDNLDKIAHLISSRYTNPYFLEDNNRLKYYSDKGTPMFVDFNLFTKKEFPDLGLRIKDGKISWSNKNLTFNKFNKTIEDYVDSKTRTLMLNWPERELVEVPETRELSKQEVYTLLGQGKSTEDILKIDPNFNPNKIRAYKAHLTMDEKGIQKGRPKKQKESELEDKVFSNELPQPVVEEKLSKEDAIWLLKQGFSTKEILDAYPDSFDDYQLRWYKADLTMKEKGTKRGRKKEQAASWRA